MVILSLSCYVLEECLAAQCGWFLYILNHWLASTHRSECCNIATDKAASCELRIHKGNIECDDSVKFTDKSSVIRGITPCSFLKVNYLQGKWIRKQESSTKHSKAVLAICFTLISSLVDIMLKAKYSFSVVQTSCVSLWGESPHKISGRSFSLLCGKFMSHNLIPQTLKC
jgi:hypothetical protein